MLDIFIRNQRYTFTFQCNTKYAKMTLDWWNCLPLLFKCSFHKPNRDWYEVLFFYIVKLQINSSVLDSWGWDGLCAHIKWLKQTLPRIIVPVVTQECTYSTRYHNSARVIVPVVTQECTYSTRYHNSARVIVPVATQECTYSTRYRTSAHVVR